MYIFLLEILLFLLGKVILKKKGKYYIFEWELLGYICLKRDSFFLRKIEKKNMAKKKSDLKHKSTEKIWLGFFRWSMIIPKSLGKKTFRLKQGSLNVIF